MKLSEILLVEKLLHSEFTFGFELEGITPNYDNLVSIFRKYIPLPGKLKNDSSIRNYGIDGRTFEWASPVLPVTPMSIKQVLNLLSNINNEKIYNF